MKIAKVIPLYKTGDKHHYTNYRPVSLLSQFSKILEKVFTKRLHNFMETHQLLDHSQYGFRKDRSTSMELMELKVGYVIYFRNTFRYIPCYAVNIPIAMNKLNALTINTYKKCHLWKL